MFLGCVQVMKQLAVPRSPGRKFRTWWVCPVLRHHPLHLHLRSRRGPCLRTRSFLPPTARLSPRMGPPRAQPLARQMQKLLPPPSNLTYHRCEDALLLMLNLLSIRTFPHPVIL